MKKILLLLLSFNLTIAVYAQKPVAESPDEAFMSYVYFRPYILGLSIEEMKSAFPQFCRKGKIMSTAQGDAYVNDDLDALMARENLTGFFIKNNKTYGYYGQVDRSDIYGDDDPTFAKGKAAIGQLLATFNSTFKFRPAEKTEQIPPTKKSSGTQTTYVWEKNGKTLTVSYAEMIFKRKYNYMIMITSIDKNLMQ